MGGLFIGMGIAEKLHLPLVQAYVVPFTPTREFSSVLTPRLPAFLNHLSHEMTRQIMWQGFRASDTIARKQVLNIPRAPFKGPFNSKPVENMPVLYGFSPAVIPTPADWRGNIHITGFWFEDGSDQWQPPERLLDFLNSGPVPIYIGFGSMSSRNPEQTTDMVIRALPQTKQRAVLLSGWSGFSGRDLPETVYMIDSIPHRLLFPRVASVVHHVCASTTAAGLAAGVPSVIIPFFGDQPFWGQRVSDLGVGPKPIARKNLTVERLANAIQEAVTNEDMRGRANELGKQIRSENGLRNAVEIINRIEI
jgi:UDP:flavonoid glycosyltransferase YjiC (YdhE family)